MRIGANPRAARAVLALLVGLLAGAWVGGGLVWVFNRSKRTESGGEVAAVSFPPADEFDLIPADAAGFVHVRVPELWKTEAMADYRRILDKAGDDAFKAFNESYEPAPNTIDRVTIVGVPKPGRKVAPPAVFVPPGKGKGVPPPPPPADDTADVDSVFILTFTTAFDPVKVRAAYLPDANKETVGDLEMWSQASGKALAFRGDRTIVAGTAATLRALLTRNKTPEGPLAPSLKLAAGGTRHVVAAWNLKAYRKNNFTRSLPPEAAAVLRADAFTAGLVVGRGARADLRAAYKDADAATAAEGDVRKAIEAGRKSLADTRKTMIERLSMKADGPKRQLEQLPMDVFALLGLGSVGTLDDWLANAALERDGAELTAKVSVESLNGTYNAGAAVWLGMMLNPMRMVGDFAPPAPGRPADRTNLKQMGLALHNYHDVYNRFPAAGHTNPPNSPRGRPLLSWRVAILPYVGEVALYNQFKQDEPWDGPNNIKLLDKMPKIFVAPRSVAPPGKTHYQVFTTAETAPIKTMFGRTVGRGLAAVSDGTSNTLMVVEATEPVEWTRPMDLPFDPDDDPPPLGLPGAGGFDALLGDGSVRFFPLATPPETLRIWIGANDGIPNPP